MIYDDFGCRNIRHGKDGIMKPDPAHPPPEQFMKDINAGGFPHIIGMGLEGHAKHDNVFVFQWTRRIRKFRNLPDSFLNNKFFIIIIETRSDCDQRQFMTRRFFRVEIKRQNILRKTGPAVTRTGKKKRVWPDPLVRTKSTSDLHEICIVPFGHGRKKIGKRD